LTSAVDEKDGTERERAYSSATESDDFSLWSDTGDIAEQLADDEDPLRIELDPLNSQGRNLNPSGRGTARKNRVTFQPQGRSEGESTNAGVDKEAISIPNPAPRKISRAEKVLALIMAPSDTQTARTRGLVGKPLLYVVPAEAARVDADAPEQIFYKRVRFIRCLPFWI